MERFKYEWVYKKSDEELLKVLPKFLKSKGFTVKKGEGYVYARQKKSSIPIMLVAHIDTVHGKPPSSIYYDREANVIWSPDGLGGDDRAGVAAILEIVERGYRPYILFLDGEERGGIGAHEAIANIMLPAKVHCLIELDRKNSNDAVFYNCGNEEFMSYIINFGYEFEVGSFSDISILCPKWDIAGVNLSIGYYNQHSSAEYVKLDEWELAVEKVTKMLKNPPSKKFDYQEKVLAPFKHSYSKYDYDYIYGYSLYDYWTELPRTKKQNNKSKFAEDEEFLCITIDASLLSSYFGGSIHLWNEWIRENKWEIERKAESQLIELIEEYTFYDLTSKIYEEGDLV